MTEEICPEVILTEQHTSTNHSLADVEPAAPGHVLQNIPFSSFEARANEAMPSAQSSLNMGRSLAQIVIVLIVLLMLVNIPFNNYKTGLAQLMPPSASVVIRDGLLFQGSGPTLYVVQDYKLRPVAGPEAFNHYFKQSDVSLVEDSLLEQMAQGPPLRLLVRCRQGSAVYALENGLKRWVKYPPLSSKARLWDQPQWISCQKLERYPIGPPILNENADGASQSP